MTKQKPSYIAVTPGQETALANALSTVFHATPCHTAYLLMVAAKGELSALQKTCSRCLTHVKNGDHSNDCSAGYRLFLSVRRAYMAEQAKCAKCAARQRLKAAL